MSIDWNGDLFTACYKRRPGFLELYKFSFGESCPEVNSSELVHVETMTDKKKTCTSVVVVFIEPALLLFLYMAESDPH